MWSPVPDPKALRRALLRWYRTNRRDLPWRCTRDPYAIWVSEIMLQQTRVAAVLEKYRLFLERFPTVQALAAAELDSVLALWSGLGYYRRARALHQAARSVAEERNGVLPSTAGAWQKLPGIGRYTAAAIGSIAFGEAVAVVDGNVERVLARLTGQQLRRDAAWKMAQQLLDSSSPGDWNQSMMELGAVICTPVQPACRDCPLRRWCRTQGEPAKRSRPARNRSELFYALCERRGNIRLVRRRDSEQRMAGMWELPAARAHSVNHPEVIYRLRHSITDTDYAVLVVRASARQGRWVPLSKLRELPLTGLTLKILRKHFGAGFPG